MADTFQEISHKVEDLIKDLISIEDNSGKFLLKLDDGRVIDTKGWNGWEWTHGIGLYGMWQYYEITGKEWVLNTILDWFNTQFAKGTTKNVNTAAVFLTLLYVYESNPQKFRSFKPWIDSWINYIYTGIPRTKFGGIQHVTYLTLNERQLWDDTLMMSVMPLLKAGVAFNRPEYVNEAKKQVLTHIQYLFDAETGLFNHGWIFAEDVDEAAGAAAPAAEAGGHKQGHWFARAKWARGNSWITIVFPDILELLDLPKEDFFRAYVEDTLEAQVAALAKLQHPDSGAWFTILDRPQDKGNYIEASATAGFAYGILKAIRKGYLDRKYFPVATKAIKAVIGDILPSGELNNTSFGTPVGDTIQDYYDIPITSMPYGQAMAMMALVEFLRTKY